MQRDPTSRFSDRVDAYSRYRPSYPAQAIDRLESLCELTSPQAVADIGSGTGILSRLLLDRGHRVYGVEPNEAMRVAAEWLLGGYPRFVSVAGQAEDTTLPTSVVQTVTAAQAFHWFDLGAARVEFERILAPGGRVAILWNDRRKRLTPFLAAYEDILLRHGTDYREVDHTRIGEAELASFFGPAGFETTRFESHQILDFAALQGRLESSSYAPPQGAPGHGEMIADLRAAFDEHQTDGTVSIDYDTVLYCGRLT